MRTLIAVLFLGLAAPLTHADTKATMKSAKAGWGACQTDVKKFCSDVQPGEGRMMSCLDQHENELSQKCISQRSEMRAKWEERKKELRAACQSDIDKFCQGVQPGPGIGQCLRSHNDQLSQTCQTETQKLRKRIERGTASKAIQ